MGTAWASGINLYAAVFMLGFMGSNGYITLPENLMVLTDPLVMFCAGLMYCLEFFIDKTPGLDSAWDSLHTFIRIPVAAVLAMGAIGDVSPAMELAAFLLGASLAGATHATKAGSRILINTSPEPVSNWSASILEDLLVVLGLWTAINHPWIFLCALLLFIVFMAWLLPKIWKGIREIFIRLKSVFRRPVPGVSSKEIPPEI